MNQKINQTLWSAYESLRVAERELMRPNEDAVTLCACQCTRNAAFEFLRSYLATKSSKPFDNYSLSGLLHQCALIDPHFKTIDISCFECRKTEASDCDKSYCIAVEKVNECVEKTHVIRELVMAKLKLMEKDFQ